MRHIDSFCHFFPAGIFKLMSDTSGGTTVFRYTGQVCFASAD